MMDESRHEYWGKQPDDVDKPAWSVLLIDPKGIKVTWQEKYGSQHLERCIGLWQNATQYMLTWKDDRKVILEKSNVNSVEYTNG